MPNRGFQLRKKGATRQDVAEIAHVSPSTVSRVLSGHPAISDQTSTRVKQIADELNYVPSHLSRSYYQKRSYRFGMVLPLGQAKRGIHNINSEHLNIVLYGAILSASEHEYAIDVMSETGLGNRKLAELVLSRRVDGLILVGCTVGDRRPAYLRSSEVPFVMVNHRVARKPYAYVGSDPETGYQELFDYLVARGVREIGFLSGSARLVDALDRERVVLKLCQHHGIRMSVRVQGDFTMPSGLAAASEFVRGKLPQIIICANDNMAFGLIEGLKENGVRIPEDVGVTGYDDFDLSNYIHPKLTTIHNPFFEIGKETCRLLKAAINGDDIPGTLFSTHLVIRESV
jgi:LacI family transcriptional regulator, galactose operon repressor